MDYGKLLDSKQKKRVLMDEFENQKNRIQYYIDEHENEESIELLEGVVTTLEEFLNSHLKDDLATRS